jgi:hypothetical protein
VKTLSSLVVCGFVLILAVGLTGCDVPRPSTPTGPSPAPQPAGLVMFTEQASGFSTSELRDAQEQIVQFNTRNELIWAADGRHLPGYRAHGNFIPAEAACKCTLVVHFGSRNGERRAYLTADYIHDNDGTVVDLEIAGGVLIVSRTNVFPPGTFTLSGVLTEVTETGQAPVENAGVWRQNDEMTGWQGVTTDKDGFYEIHGLYNGSTDVSVFKEGYDAVRRTVSINGDTRLDIQLVRRQAIGMPERRQ